MFPSRQTLPLFSATILFLAIVVTTPRASHSAPQTSPPTESALQLTIHLNDSNSGPSESPSFTVQFHNATQNALILNLGTMLANGQKLFLDGVDLIVTDPEGKTRHLLDIRTPAIIAGRVDPLVLPLCAGCNFSFPVDFTNYRLADEPNINPGHYSLEARFVGKAVSRESANLDMPGIALMPYLLGTATSNRLPFQISQLISPQPPQSQ
jgi:hypothetical protein